MPLIIICPREELQVLALSQILGLSIPDTQALVVCDWDSALKQQEQQWLET